MKIICAEKGISYSGGGEGTKLLNAIRPKTSLDGFYKSSLQIAFVIRNEYSTVHGAGTKPRTVSKHVANFVINSVAGAIQLLVDEMKSLSNFLFRFGGRTIAGPNHDPWGG